MEVVVGKFIEAFIGRVEENWVVEGEQNEVDFTLDHITEEMNVKELSHPLFTPLNMI